MVILQAGDLYILSCDLHTQSIGEGTFSINCVVYIPVECSKTMYVFGPKGHFHLQIQNAKANDELGTMFAKQGYCIIYAVNHYPIPHGPLNLSSIIGHIMSCDGHVRVM